MQPTISHCNHQSVSKQLQQLLFICPSVSSSKQDLISETFGLAGSYTYRNFPSRALQLCSNIWLQSKNMVWQDWLGSEEGHWQNLCVGKYELFSLCGRPDVENSDSKLKKHTGLFNKPLKKTKPVKPIPHHNLKISVYYKPEKNPQQSWSPEHSLLISMLRQTKYNSSVR